MALGDTPEAGLYKTQLVKRGPWVPVRIWRGFPIDPETGETREAGGWLWRALVNGEPTSIWRVWPYCGRNRISTEEYWYLLDLNTWARKYAPYAPEANPRQPVDLNRQPPLF